MQETNSFGTVKICMLKGEKGDSYDDTEVRKDLDAEIIRSKREDYALSARMDTFTALEDGSTTGDAELQDIRVGYDGKTYATAGDAVRAQVGDIEAVKRVDAINKSGWERKTASKDAQGKIKFTNSTQACSIVLPVADVATVSVGEDYWVSVIVYDSDLNVLYTTGYLDNIEHINYGAYAHSSYSVAIIVRKRTVSELTAAEAEAAANITFTVVHDVSRASSFVDTRKSDTDSVLHAILDSKIEPDQTISGKCYTIQNYAGTFSEELRNISGGVVKRYNVQSGKTYVLTSRLQAATYGIPLVVFFDENDNRIGYRWTNQPSGNAVSVENEVLQLPDGTAWFYVNSRNFGSQVYTRDGSAEEFFGASANREVSILFVGNSLTQDGIAYLPYVLQHYYPSVKFKFYMWYNGGYTLAQHYQKFVNDQPCGIFSVAENASSWTNYSNSKTMSSILADYTFDIVCVQEYFNYKDTYVEADLEDWTNVAEYIRDNYQGGNGLEFISLFHAPLRASADTVFERTVSGNSLILNKTISDDIIPIGIAVYRALSTDLDSLGDRGHLSPDGTHTQEGLPCLLQTYVALLWLLDRLSMPASLYGLPFKMTTAIYQTINVPGANLGSGVIEGTDAQNQLAQQVAIQAYKEGKSLVAGSLPESVQSA